MIGTRGHIYRSFYKDMRKDVRKDVRKSKYILRGVRGLGGPVNVLQRLPIIFIYQLIVICKESRSLRFGQM